MLKSTLMILVMALNMVPSGALAMRVSGHIETCTEIAKERALRGDGRFIELYEECEEDRKK